MLLLSLRFLPLLLLCYCFAAAVSKERQTVGFASAAQSLRDALNLQLAAAVPPPLSPSARLQELSLLPGCCCGESPIYRGEIGGDSSSKSQVLSFLFHRGLGSPCCAVPAEGDSEEPLAVLSLTPQAGVWGDWRDMPWLPELNGEHFLLRCLTVSPLKRHRSSSNGGVYTPREGAGDNTEHELIEQLTRIVNAAATRQQEKARCIIPQLRPRLDISVSPLAAVYTGEGPRGQNSKLFVVLDVRLKQRQTTVSLCLLLSVSAFLLIPVSLSLCLSLCSWSLVSFITLDISLKGAYFSISQLKLNPFVLCVFVAHRLFLSFQRPLTGLCLRLLLAELLAALPPNLPPSARVQRLFQALGLRIHLPRQGLVCLERLTGSPLKSTPAMDEGAMDAVGVKALLQHHWRERKHLLLQQQQQQQQHVLLLPTGNKEEQQESARAAAMLRMAVDKSLQELLDETARPKDIISTSSCKLLFPQAFKAAHRVLSLCLSRSSVALAMGVRVVMLEE